jgi:hypothetical protein
VWVVEDVPEPIELFVHHLAVRLDPQLDVVERDARAR